MCFYIRNTGSFAGIVLEHVFHERGEVAVHIFRYRILPETNVFEELVDVAAVKRVLSRRKVVAAVTNENIVLRLVFVCVFCLHDSDNNKLLEEIRTLFH